MARTDSTSVIAVLGDDYGAKLDGSFPDLTPYISAAGVMVDRLVACAVSREVPLTDGELTLIETWIAAHCFKQSDQALASKSTGGASGSFQGQTGKYLEGTKYGQMAVLLDYSGCLRNSSVSNVAGNVAGGFWTGTPVSQQKTSELRGN